MTRVGCWVVGSRTPQSNEGTSVKNAYLRPAARVEIRLQTS